MIKVKLGFALRRYSVRLVINFDTSTNIRDQNQLVLFFSFFKVRFGNSVQCCMFNSPFRLCNCFTRKIPLYHRLTYTKGTEPNNRTADSYRPKRVSDSRIEFETAKAKISTNRRLLQGSKCFFPYILLF